MRPLLWALLLVPVSGIAAVQPPAFSRSGLQGWGVQTFESSPPTQYRLVQDGGQQVVQAQCDDSASGLIWKGDVNLAVTPILHWRWKIAHQYDGIDERRKAGDDFPARVYVVTGSQWLPWTLKSLSYVWSNGSGAGSQVAAGGAPFWPSPYTGQARMVALRQGDADVGHWQVEQRDVRTDFKTVFDADVDHAGAVAIMTDCDNSHRRGEAWYGDLYFSAH